MDAGIGAVDHDIVPTGDLVHEPDAHHLADQWMASGTAIEQGIGGSTAIQSRLAERPLHHLDLVSALPKPVELAGQVRIELPHTWPPFLCDSQAFKRLEPTHSQCVAGMIALSGVTDGEHTVSGPCQQAAVKQRE